MPRNSGSNHPVDWRTEIDEGIAEWKELSGPKQKTVQQKKTANGSTGGKSRAVDHGLGMTLDRVERKLKRLSGFHTHLLVQTR